MSTVTLAAWKESIIDEAQYLESRLELGQNSPSNIIRLEKINEMLDILAQVEKPNSIFKKALLAKAHVKDGEKE